MSTQKNGHSPKVLAGIFLGIFILTMKAQATVPTQVRPIVHSFDDPSCTWVSGPSFASNLPEFGKIMTKLRETNWLLGDYYQLILDNVTVCKTPNQLALINSEDQDGLGTSNIQPLQAGARLRNRILIDMKIFDRMSPKDQGYLFTHELTHTFIQNVPARNTKVRSFVNSVKELVDGKISGDNFSLQMAQNDVIAPTLVSQDPTIEQPLLDFFKVKYIDEAVYQADDRDQKQVSGSSPYKALQGDAYRIWTNGSYPLAQATGFGSEVSALVVSATRDFYHSYYSPSVTDAQALGQGGYKFSWITQNDLNGYETNKFGNFTPYAFLNPRQVAAQFPKVIQEGPAFDSPDDDASILAYTVKSSVNGKSVKLERIYALQEASGLTTTFTNQIVYPTFLAVWLNDLNRLNLWLTSGGAHIAQSDYESTLQYYKFFDENGNNVTAQYCNVRHDRINGHGSIDEFGNCRATAFDVAYVLGYTDIAQRLLTAPAN